jgi:hypothetical protein
MRHELSNKSTNKHRAHIISPNQGHSNTRSTTVLTTSPPPTLANAHIVVEGTRWLFPTQECLQRSPQPFNRGKRTPTPSTHRLPTPLLKRAWTEGYVQRRFCSLLPAHCADERLGLGVLIRALHRGKLLARAIIAHHFVANRKGLLRVHLIRLAAQHMHRRRHCTFFKTRPTHTRAQHERAPPRRSPRSSTPASPVPSSPCVTQAAARMPHAAAQPEGTRTFAGNECVKQNGKCVGVNVPPL